MKCVLKHFSSDYKFFSRLKARPRLRNQLHLFDQQ